MFVFEGGRRRRRRDCNVVMGRCSVLVVAALYSAGRHCQTQLAFDRKVRSLVVIGYCYYCPSSLRKRKVPGMQDAGR